MLRLFLLAKIIPLTAILILGATMELMAQSANGCIAGRIGIDVGLYSGVIEFGSAIEPASPPRCNDWFQRTEGQGVIDEIDLTTLETLLMAPGNPTYELRVAGDLVSINGVQLWIDVVFASD